MRSACYSAWRRRCSASKPELNADLKDGGRTGTARTGARNVMVVAQVALALVLLIGAGLMLTSFARLRAVDPGFRTTDLVTVELMLPLARYDEKAQVRFYSSVLERLRPNPLTAQSAHHVPVSVRWRQRAGRPPGDRPATQAAAGSCHRRTEFDLAGISADGRPPLLSGRDFAPTDGPGSPLVALISEATVKEFGGKNPIGEQIDLGDPATVVGIVSDARRRSLDQPPRPAVYLPYTRFMLPYMGAMIRTDQRRRGDHARGQGRSSRSSIRTCRSATSIRSSRSSRTRPASRGFART